jgi:hypothetical protein
MADGPTASDTLGVIGVELWRSHTYGGLSSKPVAPRDLPPSNLTRKE